MVIGILFRFDFIKLSFVRQPVAQFNPEIEPEIFHKMVD